METNVERAVRAIRVRLTALGGAAVLLDDDDQAAAAGADVSGGAAAGIDKRPRWSRAARHARAKR